MYRICIPINNKNYTEKEWVSLMREQKKQMPTFSPYDFAVITLYK